MEVTVRKSKKQKMKGRDEAAVPLANDAVCGVGRRVNVNRRQRPASKLPATSTAGR